MCEARYLPVTAGRGVGWIVDTKLMKVLDGVYAADAAVVKAGELNEEDEKWLAITRDFEGLKDRFKEFLSGPEPSGAYHLRLNDNTGVYALIDWDNGYRVGLYTRNDEENLMDGFKEFDTIGGVRDFLILMETVFSG